ncbi:MAG: T9SS type A sorting domain-containing protein [Bacteroidales bacterium]|jgi:hypothetical protein|nr:T9SS type A sorting domain-containing protein [Bacteroidales bacterium]
MKKTLLLVMALTPVWLCAQQKVIELTPTSDSMSSYVLSSISKQTFESGKLVTSFNDGSSTEETPLVELSKVTFTTSTPTELASDASITDYTLYPMPVQDELNLSFEAKTAASATLQILSLDGRTLLSSNQTIHSGSNTLKLSVSDLAQGLYICRLSYGNEQYTQQIIKQ